MVALASCKSIAKKYFVPNCHEEMFDEILDDRFEIIDERLLTFDF
jgi:hypothetical protein